MMMDPKFTKGPWRIEVSCDRTPLITSAHAKGGIGVAFVPIQRSDLKTPLMEETAANASLIAMAPRLYEALSAITYWHDQNSAIDESWFDEARAALAEARGE